MAAILSRLQCAALIADDLAQWDIGLVIDE